MEDRSFVAFTRLREGQRLQYYGGAFFHGSGCVPRDTAAKKWPSCCGSGGIAGRSLLDGGSTDSLLSGSAIVHAEVAPHDARLETCGPAGTTPRRTRARLRRHGLPPDAARRGFGRGTRKVDRSRRTCHAAGVAAANPLAVEAGLSVLRAGGSAADAAVAVQAMLGLVEPQSRVLAAGRSCCISTRRPARSRHSMAAKQPRPVLRRKCSWTRRESRSVCGCGHEWSFDRGTGRDRHARHRPRQVRSAAVEPAVRRSDQRRRGGFRGTAATRSVRELAISAGDPARRARHVHPVRWRTGASR